MFGLQKPLAEAFRSVTVSLWPPTTVGYRGCDSPKPLADHDSLALAQMLKCIELDERLKAMDQEITVNPQFVQKVNRALLI